MRVESALPKMETKSPADKLPLDDSSNVEMEEQAHQATGSSSASTSDARVTGKRSSRTDESGESRHHSRGFDMAKASSLGRELLERKRLMLGQVTLSSSVMNGDGDVTTPPALARLAEVKVSDEESEDGGPKNSKKANRNTTPPSVSGAETRVKSEPLSEEDIQKRKAQRRREQVRAASRRCRDRQRRETEELRMKVFQLEEFISHTMQSYESELRRQRHHVESVERENETLRAKVSAMHSDHVSSSASVASSSASVTSSPGRGGWSETSTTPSVSGSDDIIWDTARIQNMHSTIETCKRAVLRILNSTAPPAIQHHAFGWHFDFWAEQSEYFVRSYKFYRGMRAHDVADRNFDVDFAKYLETFPEIKDKKVLQWPSPNVRIVQTVKDFPGRATVSSLAATFISRDDHFMGPGERWLVGSVSVGSANALTFSYEDDCNGYIFEDAIEVTSDGREVHGCMVRGIGRYESKGQEVMSLMKELAKIFASVVIRWEALFINDYMEEADAAVEDLYGFGF